MIFTLPALPYAYNALVPYIDAQTMEIHYTKHHQTYVDKLNEAIAGRTIVTGEESEISFRRQVSRNISVYHVTVPNNAGGHFNHLFFWNSLTPHGSQAIGTHLLHALEKSFGSFRGFKEAFTARAAAHFDSGRV